jgi:capsular polysaccharide transport system ATP-binding protein
MIRFENLTKSFQLRDSRKIVIDHLNLSLPTGKSLALLGRNGAGKSTLLQMIAGTMRPDHGRVISDGTISWPVGFGGSFHRDLTGAQNIRFIARIYGVDTEELIAFVEDFADIGKHFHMPVRSYSSGMKSRLTFGASMGIHFDTYLVDEVTAVGDAAFRAKSRQVFKQRMKTSSAIMVSHEMPQVREFCDAGLVLSEGRLSYFDDINAAIEAHLEIVRIGQARDRAQNGAQGSEQGAA